MFGEVYGTARMDSCQPGEESKARPKLLLVKNNRAIFLMTSGRDQELAPGEKVPLTYAEGYNPDTDDEDGWLNDRCRQAMGGSDVCEEIPLEWVEYAIETKCRQFIIQLSDNQLDLMVPRPRAA